MATITLVANTNTSALTFASGDTIDCNGFRLAVNAQPSQTNVAVVSPGKAGRMTVSGAYDLSTWSITAGTVTLIDGTFPAGATLGTATAGAAATAFAISSNAGTVTTANGGGGANARGVNINNGTVANTTGGSGSTAFGVNTNNGTVGVATGGSGPSAYGVNLNNGTVTTANGGTGGGSVGVFNSSGIVLRAFDSVQNVAIATLQGGPKLIIGPDYQTATTTYTAVPLIYSIGEVSGLAAIPGGIEIVLLSEGTGSAGFTGIRGTTRTLGT